MPSAPREMVPSVSELKQRRPAAAARGSCTPCRQARQVHRQQLSQRSVCVEIVDSGTICCDTGLPEHPRKAPAPGCHATAASQAVAPPAAGTPFHAAPTCSSSGRSAPRELLDSLRSVWASMTVCAVGGPLQNQDGVMAGVWSPLSPVSQCGSDHRRQMRVEAGLDDMQRREGVERKLSARNEPCRAGNDPARPCSLNQCALSFPLRLPPAAPQLLADCPTNTRGLAAAPGRPRCA